jgi:hypothetical protein
MLPGAAASCARAAGQFRPQAQLLKDQFDGKMQFAVSVLHARRYLSKSDLIGKVS